MLTIPTQLSKQKFILLKDKNRPLQANYYAVNNYEIDSPIFKAYLEAGNTTYGVIAGHNNLIILDFDSAETQDRVAPLLPETFTALSANKRLMHMYYFSDNLSPQRFNDKAGNRILDIQGTGTYVVGAGSILPGGKEYTILKDIAIATLPGAEIRKILQDSGLAYVDVSREKEQKRQTNEMEIFYDPVVVAIKNEQKISTFLASMGIPIYKNPTKCPYGHPSESEKNFHFDDDKGLWHCFHAHNPGEGSQGGDVITLNMELRKLGSFVNVKNTLYKELFIKIEEYEKSLKQLEATIRARKAPAITQNDVDTIAEIMIVKYLFVTIQETGKLYFYNHYRGVYTNFGEQEVNKELEKYFTSLVKTHTCVEIINKIKRRTPRSVKTFDANTSLICLANGVFNFDTKLLIPHSPTYFFINNIPVNYNSAATCPRIIKFFNEIYPNNPNLLFEICTFLLLKHNKHQKAIMIVGPTHTGKSKYLNLCEALIGKENTSVKSMAVLAEDRFATSGLFGKMANISADIPPKRVVNSDVFKSIVSGSDLIDAQFKGQDSFQFVCKTKLLFSCNQIPSAADQTDGYLSKWVILQFTRQFLGGEDNKNLIDEITTDEELSGLFNECVRRFDKVDVTGLDYNESNDDIADLYNNLADPIGTFMNEHCSSSNMSEIPFSEFVERYNVWCVAHNLKELSVIAAGRSLRARGIKMNKVNAVIDGKTTTQNVISGYVWAGEANDIVNLQ
jgi:putative DNA primase/helicase